MTARVKWEMCSRPHNPSIVDTCQIDHVQKAPLSSSWVDIYIYVVGGLKTHMISTLTGADDLHGRQRIPRMLWM